MGEEKSILNHCLYFTANSLSRIITRMAEEEFRKTGLSPSHAFLMMLAMDEPGIGQKSLCEQLNLAPSTVTRFVDALVQKGYLTRKTEGKTANIFPTERGIELRSDIDAAWKSLHQRYAAVLGLQAGDELTGLIDQAAAKLGKA
jgi:DNA-binding MarR family transcriptional regulator